MKKVKAWGFIVKCIPLLIAATAFFSVSCEVDTPSDGTFDSISRSGVNAFPHHVIYAGNVIKPDNVTQTEMDTSVQTHYNAWKSAYVKSLSTNPVQKWIKYQSDNTTVSEAMGYGMVIAAYMGDKTDFDAMYYYTLAHPTENSQYLLAWKQKLQSGKMVDIEGVDAATDGDLDVAYALLLADAQWGSSGTINYKARALNVLHAILQYEVIESEWILKLGDWQGNTDYRTRPSDFMVEHLLVFAEVDTANATKWTNVYDKINTIVNYQYNTGGSINTGLMGDFYIKSGSNYVPVSGETLEGPHDGDFGYNSCRTPWRLAMAYITKGDTALLAQQQKQASWISGSDAANGLPTSIKSGYYVKNGPNGSAYASSDDLCFTAPFAVNAMLGGSAGQTWLNNLWASITGGDYASTVNYFNDAIRLQCLIVVSGNWWLPTTSTPTQYTITASAGSNGSISPSGAVAVNSGSSRTFAITPNSGYSVNTVTVDGTSQGAITSYTFSNVTANHTISATFKVTTVTQYTITASSGSNGSINPSGSVPVTSGSSQTFAITPNSGYTVDTVTVDGTSQGAVTSYTFSNVTANHTISATFKVATVTQYTITASSGSNGSISPSGSVTVNSGASQTFAITPNSGYAVNTVTVDGTSQGAITSYAFSNVIANHTISATFVQSSSSNIAPSGTGYVWKNNSSATSNSNRSAKTGVNNNNLTTNVDISSGDSANRWEAAGVVFSGTKTITSVTYYSGDVTSDGDGYFEANAKLQFSTNGTTWTDSGWTVSPAFVYTSTDCGKTFVFSGSQISGIKGVRVVGQVRVAGSSYYARVKEVQIFGQ